jgi:hypothetical protein
MLQALIDAAPNGTPSAPTIIDITGEDITSEETILIRDRKWLTIRGGTLRAFTDGSTVPRWPGAPSVNWPRTRSHVRIDGNSVGVTIEGLTIRGPHPNGGTSEWAYVSALEAQHGIDVSSVYVTDITVQGCDVTDVYGDFYYVKASERITIEGNVGARNGRQGVAVVRGHGIRIVGNDLRDVRRSAIDLEPNTSHDHISDVLIADNVAHNHRLSFIAGKGSPAEVHDVRIVRNIATAGGMLFLGHERGKRSGLVIADNDIEVRGAGVPWARILGTTGVVIADNRVTFDPAREMPAVGLYYGSTAALHNNTFQFASGHVVTDDTSTWEELVPEPDNIQWTVNAEGTAGTWQLVEPAADPEPPPPVEGHAVEIDFGDGSGPFTGTVTSPDGTASWTLTGTAVAD